MTAICTLCGYLPLAIGMLARQLHHHPAWTAAGLAGDLAAARDRLELLASEHVSVAAGSDLSYADLDDVQQRLFRRLALHPGPDIDHYAAAAFELDLPEVMAFKDTVLAIRNAIPRCERTTVPADLREDRPAKLTTAGFDRTIPAAWLAEGLLLYLTADEAGRMLAGVTELSAPGSQLSFEHSPAASTTLTAHTRQMPVMQEYTTLWKGGLGAGAPRWLTSHGWQPCFHELTALAASYGRPAPDSDHGGFLTATRAVSEARLTLGW